MLLVRFSHQELPRRMPAWFKTTVVVGGGTAALVSSLVWPGLLVIGFVTLFLLIVLGGTVRGAAASMNVARLIGEECDDPARSALLYLLPIGTLGVTWLLAVRGLRLYRVGRRLGEVVMMAQSLLTAGMVVVLIFIISPTIIFSGDAFQWQVGLLGVLLMGAILLWMALDNVQGTMFGVVCGMWGSSFSARHGPQMAGIAGFGLYLALTVVVGILSLMVYGAMLDVLDISTQTVWWVDVALWLVLIGAAFALRELAMRAVWWWMCRRINAEGTELGQVL
jgi:hypothetical protein